MSDKFIDFIITQKCTYKCIYCSQSKNQMKNKSSASDSVINAFLSFLNNISKDFEITITGGEAMLHPRFFELISKIKNLGFKINLITNFSFEIELYKKTFDIVNNSLNRFDISFHIDEILKQYKNPNDLFLKLSDFLNLKPDSTRVCFFIPLFNLTEEKEKYIDSIVSFAHTNNIDYEFQNIRFLNKYVNKKSGKYKVQNKSKNTYSNLCFSGCKSAVIYEDGNVYRCYSSRFTKSNYLGNIASSDFKLNKSSLPCVFKSCMCPKPLLYNQVTDKKDELKTIILQGINFIYLPYLFIKNLEIVKSKLKQYFN